MKKLLGIVFLGLLWCNVGIASANAEELNKNCIRKGTLEFNKTVKQRIKKNFVTVMYFGCKSYGTWGLGWGEETSKDLDRAHSMAKKNCLNEASKRNIETCHLFSINDKIVYGKDAAFVAKVEKEAKAQYITKAVTGCIKGDCYNGQGTETFENGYKYVGEFKNGKRHGQGTLTWPYWKSLLPGYKGSYKGKYDGTFSKYVGEFKNGLRHGKGTQTYPEGYKYVGEFKDDEKNGQGIETLWDGSTFIGEFKDDHRILSIEDYKKLAEENNILITGDYIYLLAAYGGAPEPDNLSHYYNFNNALGIANDVYRRGLRYVFSPKSPSTLKKLTFKKERNIRTRNEFTSKRTKNFRSFQFTAEYEDNITLEIFVEYKKKTKNFKKAEEKALYYSNMYGQMPHFLKKYNKRILIHEYISNDDEWFHELGELWAVSSKQEFHISKNAKCKNKKEYMERDLYLHTYKQSYSECALVMIHELAHVVQKFTSVIPPSKWVKAVKLDNKKYCSRYAKINEREDFAESLVCWIVLRHKLNKIGIMDFKKINKFMPNRIKFFDELNFNMYPIN